MLKKSFQKELNKLSILNARYKEQLTKVENAIIKEFGKCPSEIDFEEFIDSYHVGIGHLTVDEINEGMLNHRMLNDIT